MTPSINRLSLISAIGVLCFLPILGQAQQKRGPSTSDERARAVEVAKALRTDPLSSSIKGDREWLVRWLIEVPDISVSICTNFLGDLGKGKSGYPGAIIASMMASEAGFVIEHPDKAKESNAIYLAGVDGALDTYQAIQKKDAKFRLPKLEDLIQKRDQGKLEEYVSETAKTCK